MPSVPSFHNPQLLRQALTHSSYHKENPEAGPDNERLEFLGDAILTFLCGEFLYQRNSTIDEGEMTRLRTALVNGKQLAKFARVFNLDKRLYLGVGVERSNGRQNPRLLGSAFEAVVGAYYLDCDSDIQPVRDWVWPLFERVTKELFVDGERSLRSMQSQAVDYKSLLQEKVLADLELNPDREPPRYHTKRIAGTDDAPVFQSMVTIAGMPVGTGQGSSKKAAEKAAAQDALEPMIEEKQVEG
ncbi:MAG: ribonuclease III [Spirulina sp. SIO3F2]|nr:ribonuclease III [Spirulina sp. SIO3F2]